MQIKMETTLQCPPIRHQAAKGSKEMIQKTLQHLHPRLIAIATRDMLNHPMMMMISHQKAQPPCVTLVIQEDPAIHTVDIAPLRITPELTEPGQAIHPLTTAHQENPASEIQIPEGTKSHNLTEYLTTMAKQAPQPLYPLEINQKKSNPSRLTLYQLPMQPKTGP